MDKVWYSKVINGPLLTFQFLFVVGTSIINWIYWLFQASLGLDYIIFAPGALRFILLIGWLFAYLHYLARSGQFVDTSYAGKAADKVSMLNKPAADRVLRWVSFGLFILGFIAEMVSIMLIMNIIYTPGSCALHSICVSFTSQQYKWMLAWVVMEIALIALILVFIAVKLGEFLGSSPRAARIFDLIITFPLVLTTVASLVMVIILMVLYSSDILLWEFIGYNGSIIIMALFWTIDLIIAWMNAKNIAKGITEMWPKYDLARVLLLGMFVLAYTAFVRMFGHYVFAHPGCAGLDFCTDTATSHAITMAIFFLNLAGIIIAVFGFSFRFLTKAAYIDVRASNPQRRPEFDLGDSAAACRKK